MYSAPLACGRWDGDTLVLPVRVQTRARRLHLGALTGGRVKLALTAPPVDGKANAQACEFLAELCGVSPSRVTLVQGASSRDKLFRIARPQRIPPALLARGAP
jgi:hypothetical protein